MEILFDLPMYQVLKLEAPVVVNNNGLGIELNYAVFNKHAGVVESYQQFLPGAIEQVNMLNSTLETNLAEPETPEEATNVVSISEAQE